MARIRVLVFFTALLPVVMGVMLVGCAAPRWFERPAPETLVLGATTYQQALQLYGDPRDYATMTLNGENVKRTNYSFQGGDRINGVIPTKGLTLWFWKDMLVGYCYGSSYREDNTNFDESKIASIKKGETTIEEVTKLMGHPCGMYIYPCTENADTKGLQYFYFQAKSMSDSYTKVATILYNKDGIVTEVTSSSEGAK